MKKSGKQMLRHLLHSLNSTKSAKGTPAGYYIDVLEGFEEQFRRMDRKTENVASLRILYGPGFSVYPPSFVLDRLLSIALRTRGAQIIPVYCDALQTVECNFFGGVWQNGNFEDRCQSCVAKSKQLWGNGYDKVLRLSQYVNADQRTRIEALVAGLRDGEWLRYSEDGLPLGGWAKDILVNNWVVADHTLIPRAEELGKAHLKNLLLLTAAYGRILDTEGPDRVVANDSYYGMWAILERLCQHREIPFYSYWPATKTRTAFASNGPAMGLNFLAAWPSFSRVDLTDKQVMRVEKWREDQAGGKQLLINTAAIMDHQNVTFDLAKIDPRKPTALLAANVIWDLAALNKQVVFDDMIDWIAETISWFAEHPEYQLIIKAHPAEQNPTIPETQERVETALAARGISLESNIFLLPPKVKLSVYQLLPFVTVGLVYTTTVGIEMVASGIPVITSAKAPYRGFGFTYDPVNRHEYFSALDSLLAPGKPNCPLGFVESAKKFIFFYHFHYYCQLGLTVNTWGADPEIIIDSVDALFPGKSPGLDYMVDSIIHGLPIVSEERWPPET